MREELKRTGGAGANSKVFKAGGLAPEAAERPTFKCDARMIDVIFSLVNIIGQKNSGGNKLW